MQIRGSRQTMGFYGTRKIFISMTTFLVPKRECYFSGVNMSTTLADSIWAWRESEHFFGQSLLSGGASAKAFLVGDHRSNIL